MDTLLLVDGNAVMHRAYHAIPLTFKAPDGTPTNAVYGFLSMLFKCATDYRPAYLAICFDRPEPTFREKLLVTYQAQRPKADGEFVTQIPVIRSMLDAAKIRWFEYAGYEADDIIGTLTRRFETNAQIRILTGDKDIMQLVNNNVHIIAPQTGLSNVKEYDSQAVVDRLGVEPDEIPELKALMGDPSDNYQGAKGIGPKTAVKLIQKYQTVENLLKHFREEETGRIRELLEQSEENIKISMQLSRIQTNVPIECTLDELRFRWFDVELGNFLTNLGIKSLKNKIFEGEQNIKANKDGKQDIEKKDVTDEQYDLFS